MVSHGVRVAFERLSKDNEGLISKKEEDIGHYKFHFVGSGKGKGVFVNNPRFKLIAQVDVDKSKLGPYGNLCGVPKGAKATQNQLTDCKFTCAFTYPDVAEGHIDFDLSLGVSRQIEHLNQMLYIAKDFVAQSEADDRAKAGKPEDAGSVDEVHWVRFVKTEDVTKGWIHVTLGKVYDLINRPVKGRKLDLSPRKTKPAQEGSAPEKLDIDPAEDPDQHFEGAKYNLRHNEGLPCFLPNGERIGRTSSELRRELYFGRWVELEVEPVLWNFAGPPRKQIYQLQLIKLVVLPPVTVTTPPGIVHAPLLKKDYVKMSLQPESVKEQGSSGAGTKRKAADDGGSGVANASAATAAKDVQGGSPEKKRKQDPPK